MSDIEGCDSGKSAHGVSAPHCRIGLVAGWGRFPVLVAQALKAAGREVYCVALRDHADPALAEICDEYYPSGVARLGWHIRYFQRRGITQATLAGKIFKHKLLFRKLGWLSLIPDLTTIRTFFPLFVTRQKNRNDDSLLSVVVEEYARSGITLAPATDFAPELLVKLGTLTRRQVTSAERDDIAFGWQIAKEMGRLDVGQSVVVKGRAVIAVEAVEGTDECIRRAGELCPQGGFTVVKVAKPQQDMRFDVPTIGVFTIQTLAAAGGKVLAIEAEKTIVVDRADVIRLADERGLSIVALEDDAMGAEH
ncbi:MAG TPA: UDP-2,3-diacylglucosamine diphosphatase LpxI [Pirellulaceae bacterium]|nr:UDP-2,3-diacylglucosamine diphosphatase LpxI [Pirellulaceae bacterium]